MKNTLELPCIVGGEQCLYTDKSALIAGNVSPTAEKAFKDGKNVRLPGQSNLLFTEAMAGQSIIVDEKSCESSGKLNIDQLLASKLQEDIKNQDKKPDSKVESKTLSPPVLSKIVTKTETLEEKMAKLDRLASGATDAPPTVKEDVQVETDL